MDLTSHLTVGSGAALAVALIAGVAAPAVAVPAEAAALTASGSARHAIDDLDGDLAPKPKVTVTADASCGTAAGIAYVITTHNAPVTATGVEFQWMDENGATSQSLAQTGTVPSGEGLFDVRALLHTTTGFYASDWQEVVIDCDNDLPLRANPDFTG
ncbi:hypothetical protein IT882_15490 [Microbacterium schleiferi]|uniref:Ig-like domain-containing protein n=1 Tax=Microbacterium schleiferi TaxID=69362 RepID=A0A7S8MWJ0_9MICO|nr:hypothetical protein [Microbacterium schleiferi]QPE04509.1 hypothetical protein IT882_15490 [Microbacterium schleiferi]